ncbi:MAG: YidC/Oxa1 family membrane protein insertase [Clostridia bacterium]|nr:YidC/Oxa1 family membrane protein insertase [Clostridia bacterium]
MTTFLNAAGGIYFPLLEQGYKIGLDWLGHFARVIIEGVGFIGLGIIVFTIILKAITLPFDIYQRVKMRKQTLIMREMQPELEKLQKQYANDKTAYSQKMMELYKKNGYSMFGACLPMIISMVILIVAFQGFRTYSDYANLNLYINMSEQYNTALLEYSAEGRNYRLAQEGKEYEFILPANWKENDTHEIDGILYTYYTETIAGENGTPKVEKYLEVMSSDESKFLYYYYSLDTSEIVKEYKIDVARLKKHVPKAEAGGDLPYPAAAEFISEHIENAWKAAQEANASFNEAEAEVVACTDYAVKIGATAVKEWYRKSENQPRFLWVNNVWYPDVSYNHPIQSWSSFKSAFGSKTVQFAATDERDAYSTKLSNIFDETRYENLVSELTYYKAVPNGYFVLIILSIGLMVLSQFISMRSQKESNKYQTVDGSGAASQKMMLIIMPIIYAIFAFMYSAAFSIYMTMSSAISIIVTLLSNLIIGAIFKKKEEAALKEKYTRRLPWQKQEETDKKKKKKK